MTRPPTVLRRLLSAGLEQLANHYHVAPERREAFIHQGVHIIEAQASAMWGGEQVRLWVSRTPSAERAARRERVVRALKAGEDPAAVAKREGITERHARRLVGQLHP